MPSMSNRQSNVSELNFKLEKCGRMPDILRNLIPGSLAIELNRELTNVFTADFPVVMRWEWSSEIVVIKPL